MQKVKIRPADFPITSSRFKMDLPVVLSLAGIISVAAVIGAAAFHSGLLSDGTRYLTSMITSSDGAKTQTETKLSLEVSRLNRKLAQMSAQLQELTNTQTTTSARVDEIEEAFTATASIPSSAVLNSSPYYRILETGWDADDMVTRGQKRDRVALLKSDAALSEKDQLEPVNALAPKRYAIELASYENIITARNAWSKLTETHPSLLNSLEPHLLPALDAKNKKDRVKLMAGPIDTALKAAQVCSLLRSSGQACQERLFSASNITVVSAPENSAVQSPEEKY